MNAIANEAKADKVPSAAPPLSTQREAAGLLFLSGRLALEEGKLVGTTIREQTETVLTQVKALLVDEGLGLEDVIKVTVWLSSADDFNEFNRSYADWFSTPYPARSTVVSQLLVPGALVEIECVAKLRP